MENKLKEVLRFKMLGQLSHEKTELDIESAYGVCKDFTLSFLTFLRENYHSDTEAWSFDKLPIGFYQDKITYDIISVEEIFNIFIESYEK